MKELHAGKSHLCNSTPSNTCAAWQMQASSGSWNLVTLASCLFLAAHCVQQI